MFFFNYFHFSKCQNTNNIDIDDPQYYVTKDFQFDKTKTEALNMKTLGSPTFPLVPSQDSFRSEADVDVADYTEPEKLYENEDNYYKSVIGS